MTDDTDALAALFLDVTESEEVVERQEEGPSHAPVEDTTRDGIPAMARDGLEDALGTTYDAADEPS